MPSYEIPEFDEATASQFLREVADQLTAAESERFQYSLDSLRSDASRLVRENAELAEDSAGTRWLALSSMLLATYRSLLPSLEDQERTLEVLGEALTRPFKQQITSFIQMRFGISQDARGEAFRLVSENFRSRGEATFGRGFRYVDDIRDGGRVFVNIERCLFNEFFRRNGSPEVTPLMCAMDNVWADELSKPEYGVKFERPTTLARGGDSCRFQFTKTAGD